MTPTELAANIHGLANEYEARKKVMIRSIPEIEFDKGVVFGMHKVAEIFETAVAVSGQADPFNLTGFDGKRR